MTHTGLQDFKTVTEAVLFYSKYSLSSYNANVCVSSLGNLKVLYYVKFPLPGLSYKNMRL